MCFLFIFFTGIHSEVLKDRILNISFTTEWKDTPLLSETISFIGSCNEESYWSFLRGLSKCEQIPQNISEIKDYSFNYLSEELYSLLQVSLISRYCSPKIEMNRELARKYCGDNMNNFFMILNDEKIDDLSIFQKRIRDKIKSRPKVYSFEPIFGNNKDIVIIYSSPYNSTFLSFIGDLDKYGEFYSFVYRPIGLSNEDKTSLKCYGVEIKPFNYSMDYLKIKNQNIEKGKETEDMKLIKDKNIQIGTNLPKIDQITTQIIQFCKKFDDPFSTLIQVLQNFPLFADHISKLPASQTLKQQIFMKKEDVQLNNGVSSVYINGRLVQNPNIYNILDISNEELFISQILNEYFGLSYKSLNQVLHLTPVGNVPEKFVLYYRSSFIYSLNDIEQGKIYSNWTTKISTLSSTELKKIRKNLFNVVFLIDPNNKSDLKIIEFLDEQVRNAIPFKMSYIVSPKTRSKYSKKVLYAWAHLRLKYGPEKSHLFLLNTQKSIKKGEKLKEYHYKINYEKLIKKSSPQWKDLDKLFVLKSKESKHLKRLRKHLEKLGVQSPGVLFNGKYYSGKRLDRSLDKLYLKSLPRLQMLLKEHVFNKKNKTTIDNILEGEDVFSRYNPIIQHKDKLNNEFVSIEKQSYSFQKSFLMWCKNIRYNMKNDDIKFNTFWIFIGEKYFNSVESKHIKNELEVFIEKMSNDTRVAFFSDGIEGELAMNALPPIYIQKFLKLKEDEICIIFNGRVIRLKNGLIYNWASDDFELLQKYEFHRSTSILKNLFNENIEFDFETISLDLESIDNNFYSELIFYLSILYGSLNYQKIQRYSIPESIFSNSPIVYNFINNDLSFLNYQIFLNPYDEQFQFISPIVKFLRDLHAFNIQIYLNFPREIKEYPKSLRSFYRFLLDEKEKTVIFDRFLSDIIYSIVPHFPDKWIIKCETKYLDFNNFLPQEYSPGSISCNYKLISILFEGNLVNTKYEVLPNMNLVLNMNNNCKYEGISLKEYGYFQIETLPGIWNLSIHQNQDVNNEIIISHFLPESQQIFVEEQKLNNVTQDIQEEEVINIFSVVSGFLYERLAKIMVLSVIKNTKHKVHFWFLENFVSPVFKDNIKIMSEKYHFEVSFIEYKWPQWLHPQKEIQRIIWGYKILFLDCLFPKSLKRVIYLDADSVVRGDLMELMKFDLKGKPYGFVPFCTSRTEMKKYQFWTKGYWKNRLNGNKYHISAMFVIDLVRFRRMNAGYKLRKHYSHLVTDPKSLSNLDQDLPNDAQQSIPIYSLPSKYLWCCTWCSEKEKDKSLIIDLANNPKTKISKIEMAKHFIEEWEILDDEINNINNKSYINHYNLTEIRRRHRKSLIGTEL